MALMMLVHPEEVMAMTMDPEVMAMTMETVVALALMKPPPWLMLLLGKPLAGRQKCWPTCQGRRSWRRMNCRKIGG